MIVLAGWGLFVAFLIFLAYVTAHCPCPTCTHEDH